MEVEEWFRAFIHAYRKIIDSRFASKKQIFPFYPPIDITVCLVEDPKGIFPEIIAFFDSGINDVYAASNSVVSYQKKIEWPKDFDNLEGIDRKTAIAVVDHESFYDESGHPGLITQEVFPPDTFSSKPEDIATIYVQRHLIHDQQKERFKLFLKLSEIRRRVIGSEKVKYLQSMIIKMHGMDDKDKATLLCEIFWAMGFEVVNLETLKELSEFKELNSIPHVDLIALLLQEKILVAVEEGEMKKERWYKLHSLGATLKAIKFLGEKEDWQTSFVAIGRKSKGIEYLEGSVQVMSADCFQQISKEYFESKRWAPALDAFRKILGYRLDFFKIKS